MSGIFGTLQDERCDRPEGDGDETEDANQELHDGLALEVTYAAAIAKRDSLAMQFPTILRG